MQTVEHSKPLERMHQRVYPPVRALWWNGLLIRMSNSSWSLRSCRFLPGGWVLIVVDGGSVRRLVGALPCFSSRDMSFMTGGLPLRADPIQSDNTGEFSTRFSPQGVNENRIRRPLTATPCHPLNSQG